jgi:tetratricopeptide (TPR) repeat protein
VVVAAIGLTVASQTNRLLRRTRPWLLFGWLWFLGTLVPGIGMIQVGAQSMADRYMYIPILGLFTLVVWQSARLVHLWPRTRAPLIAATASGLIAFGLMTVRQVTAWKNSISLHEHSIAAGEDNAAVRYLLAVALQAAGRPQSDVVAQFQRALELQPDYVNARTQLAVIALSNQRMEEARTIIEETVRLEPGNPGLHANLGAYWVRAGKPDNAIRHFEHALQLEPRSVAAHHELGQIRLAQNQIDAALLHYAARARLDKWNPDALADYGTLLSKAGRLDEARAFLERALWIRPDFPRARNALDTTNQLLAQPR